MQEMHVQSLGQADTLEKQPTPVFLPGKSHEQQNLAVYSPWGRKKIGHDLVAKQQPQRFNPTWGKGGMDLRTKFHLHSFCGFLA